MASVVFTYTNINMDHLVSESSENADKRAESDPQSQALLLQGLLLHICVFLVTV